MSRLPINDPRVQFAIRTRGRKQAYVKVLEALEAQAMSVAELMETLDLDRGAVCTALDRLRIEGAVEQCEEEDGKWKRTSSNQE